MKRTKQVQIMVDSVNRILENNRVINKYDSDVSLMCHLLMEARCYRGFNWFYIKKINGEYCKLLVGSVDADKIRALDGFIQIY